MSLASRKILSKIWTPIRSETKSIRMQFSLRFKRLCLNHWWKIIGTPNKKWTRINKITNKMNHIRICNVSRSRKNSLMLYRRSKMRPTFFIDLKQRQSRERRSKRSRVLSRSSRKRSTSRPLRRTTSSTRRARASGRPTTRRSTLPVATTLTRISRLRAPAGTTPSSPWKTSIWENLTATIRSKRPRKLLQSFKSSAQSNLYKNCGGNTRSPKEGKFAIL